MFLSVYLATVGGATAKRLTFLVAEACGIGRNSADAMSDEVGIVAAQTLGTACSILTLNPGGLILTFAHTALLENDMARKRANAD